MNNKERIFKDLIEFLKKTNPYPEDIFKSEKGKIARLGYNACVRNVEKYLKELEED